VQIANLKKSLKNVALGKAFVLQGGMVFTIDIVVVLLIYNIGDCAELFDYCNQDMIEAKVKLLLQMSLVLIWGMSSHVLLKTID
jgi:3-deoxy-7-phosphoheptulonate synthase